MSPLYPLRQFALSDRANVEQLEGAFAAQLFGLLSDGRLWSDGVAQVRISSGWRSYAQQLDLYTRWRLPKSDPRHYDVPSVAKPGTSKHERGEAADLDLAWRSPVTWALVHEVAADYGLRFPVAGEPWHVEDAPGDAPAMHPLTTTEEDDYDMATARELIDAALDSEIPTQLDISDGGTPREATITVRTMIGYAFVEFQRLVLAARSK